MCICKDLVSLKDAKDRFLKIFGGILAMVFTKIFIKSVNKQH